MMTEGTKPAFPSQQAGPGMVPAHGDIFPVLCPRATSRPVLGKSRTAPARQEEILPSLTFFQKTLIIKQNFSQQQVEGMKH